MNWLLIRAWAATALRVAPFVAIGVLAIALMQTRATLARVRLEHKVESANADRDAAKVRAIAAERVESAVSGYAERTLALKPILVTSTKEVIDYAHTPAGSARCLDAERVHGLDELDATIQSPGAARGRADTVQANPGPPAG